MPLEALGRSRRVWSVAVVLPLISLPGAGAQASSQLGGGGACGSSQHAFLDLETPGAARAGAGHPWSFQVQLTAWGRREVARAGHPSRPAPWADPGSGREPQLFPLLLCSDTGCLGRLWAASQKVTLSKWKSVGNLRYYLTTSIAYPWRERPFKEEFLAFISE